MKTSDLIALFLTSTDITDIVDKKVHNSRVPTKDARTGEIDAPFVWVQFRNNLNWSAQKPVAGEQPMGKVYDVECVDVDMSRAERLAGFVRDLHGFQGAAGAAAIDMLTIQDQADDYQPRNAPADSGLFVSSLLVQVIGE